jgi:hypothetical protein
MYLKNRYSIKILIYLILIIILFITIFTYLLIIFKNMYSRYEIIILHKGFITSHTLNQIFTNENSSFLRKINTKRSILSLSNDR